MGQQENDAILAKNVFDAFSNFQQAWKKAEDAGLTVYARLLMDREDSFSEAWKESFIEVTRKWVPK